MLDQNNSFLTLAVRATQTTDALKAAVVSEQAKLTWPQESSSVQEGSGERGCSPPRGAKERDGKHQTPLLVGSHTGRDYRVL